MAVKNRKEGLTVDKIYKVILLVVTASFIIALALVIFKPFGYHNLDSLKEIEATNIVVQKPENNSQYLVFVYEEGADETEMVAEKIVEYAKYARNNKDAKQIYVVKKTSDNINTILSYLSASFEEENGFPCLLTISSGSVSQTKSTVSTILDTLDTEMKNK
jgi:hypothetical protein